MGDLRDAINRRWSKPEWLVFWEVGNATGGNVRRHADAVALSVYPSRGLAIHGIEMKASRQDWLKELANPEKSEAVQKFCDAWWLVATEGIVEVSEVPATWGLLVLKNRRLHTIKQAPQLEAQPVTRGFLCAILRRAQEGMIYREDVTAEIAKAREEGKASVSMWGKEEKERMLKEVALVGRFRKASGHYLYDGNVEEFGRLVKQFKYASQDAMEDRAREMTSVANLLLAGAKSLRALAPSEPAAARKEGEHGLD